MRSLPRAFWLWLILLGTAGLVFGGGPGAILSPGKAFRWPADQAISFAYDGGPLGSVPNGRAVAIVRQAFAVWENAPVARIRFQDAGSVETDLTAENFHQFFDGQVRPENPVVFDSDGRILDKFLGAGASQSVLGFSAPRYIDADEGLFLSSWIILNGRRVDEATLRSVALHEIGHFLGLDHTQIGTEWYYNSDPQDDAFIPVMFPLHIDVADRGLSADDLAWLGWLYPNPDHQAATGTIRGHVVRPSGEPAIGVNIVAVKVEREHDGSWRETPDRVSSVTGFFETGESRFELPGLSPGHYVVFMEALEAEFTGISSVGPSGERLNRVEEEYFNGALESGTDLDDPLDREVLVVKAGSDMEEINLVTNEWRSELIFPARLPLGRTLDTFVGVALVNPTPNRNEIGLRARTVDGSEDSHFKHSRGLNGHEQEAFTTDEILKNPAGALIARGENGPVQGFFMVGEKGLQAVDGIGGRMIESQLLYFPFAHSNARLRTTLFLSNVSESREADVRLQLYGPEGALRTEVVRNIPPGGILLANLSDLFALGNFDDGYVKVVSDQAVRGFQMLERDGNYAAATARPGSASVRFLAPHFFVDSTGGDTELRLVSLDAEDRLLQIEVLDDDSTVLASRQVLLPAGHVVTRNLSDMIGRGKAATGQIRVVQADSLEMPPRLLGSVVFSGNGGRFLSTLPLLDRGHSRTVFLHVAQSESVGMFTGLAVLNPSNTTVTVTVRIFDRSGQSNGTRTLVLEPGRRVVDLLNGDTFFGTGFQQVQGHFVVESDLPVVSFALFGSQDLSFLAAIEGQRSLDQ